MHMEGSHLLVLSKPLCAASSQDRYQTQVLYESQVCITNMVGDVPFAVTMLDGNHS